MPSPSLRGLRPLRAAATPGSVLVAGALAVASCAGIQQQVDVLRAKRIEIIDDGEHTKLDVELELRALKDRVAKLEADLAAAKASPSALPSASAAPSAVASVPPSTGPSPVPPSSAAPSASARRVFPGRRPSSSGARPGPGASSNPVPDVF